MGPYGPQPGPGVQLGCNLDHKSDVNVGGNLNGNVDYNSSCNLGCTLKRKLNRNLSGLTFAAGYLGWQLWAQIVNVVDEALSLNNSPLHINEA